MRLLPPECWEVKSCPAICITYVVPEIEPTACSYQGDTLPTELPAKLQNFKGRIYKSHREWLNTKSNIPWQELHGDPTTGRP